MCLATLGIHLHYSKQTNGYQRVQFAFNSLLSISKIESNYHFAWIMGLIDRFNLGKTSQDKITIYQPQQATPPVDFLLGFTPPSQNSTGSLPVHIVVGIKTVFPLFNEGINKITVSSNLLATSQYINEHKTATIAELQIGPSTNTQMNPIQVANSFDWKRSKFYFTMGRHAQYAPYIFPSAVNWANDPEYLTDILPGVFRSCHSDSGLLDNSNFFEIIAIHVPPSGQTAVVPRPADNQRRDRAGELCISLDALLSVSDQWFFEVKKIHPSRTSQTQLG